eukprot:COSAG01_NODE_235_length_20918_cov_41.045086_21_plen_81_part_00
MPAAAMHFVPRKYLWGAAAQRGSPRLAAALSAPYVTANVGPAAPCRLPPAYSRAHSQPGARGSLDSAVRDSILSLESRVT